MLQPRYSLTGDVEEDRFFTLGMEHAGKSRSSYDRQLAKRKVMVGIGIGVGVVALLACIAGLAYALSHRKLNYSCPPAPDGGKADLVFFVVGDWGRTLPGSPSYEQQRAARIMGDVGECMPPSFIISTGDNFYPSGLRSASDPQFKAAFTDVYSHPSLQVPWYVVLGNHDYNDGMDFNRIDDGTCLGDTATEELCVNKCCYSPLWELHPNLTARDPRWLATRGVVTRTFELAAATNGSSASGASASTSRRLDIILVDTNPVIYQYNSKKWAGFLGGMLTQNGSAIKEQLEAALAASVASGSQWRIVVGHHPVRSYGQHCTQASAYDCADMAFMVPLLAQYRVAAYFNGHDHDQQLIKAPGDPVHYAVTGAGAETRTGEFLLVNTKDALYVSDDQGFMAVALTNDTLALHFYVAGSSRPAYSKAVPLPAW